MLVKELIAILQQCDPNSYVVTYDTYLNNTTYYSSDVVVDKIPVATSTPEFQSFQQRTDKPVLDPSEKEDDDTVYVVCID